MPRLLTKCSFRGATTSRSTTMFNRAKILWHWWCDMTLQENPNRFPVTDWKNDFPSWVPLSSVEVTTTQTPELDNAIVHWNLFSSLKPGCFIPVLWNQGPRNPPWKKNASRKFNSVAQNKNYVFLVHYQHLLAILLQMFCIYTCANVNDRPMSSQDDPLSGHCHVTVSQCHFRVPLPSSPPSIRCWLTHTCVVVSLCCWNNMISSKCQLFETTDPRVLSFPFPFPCMLYSCSLHIPFISLLFLSCSFHFPFSLIKGISAEQNPPDLHSPDWRSTLIWVS